MRIDRRGFVFTVGAAAVEPLRSSWPGQQPTGRLAARPHPPAAGGTVLPGLAALGLATPRDTQLYVPSTYRKDRPTGLILGLHGATQDSAFTLQILRGAAEQHGHLLLAPNSRGISWDLIRNGFGADESLIDRALSWTFDHAGVDPGRIVIAGFSDGATAALSLGLINGDLFRRIIAFSPGFVVGDERHGRPAIFISHGTRDQILPIEDTSNRIVPRLRSQGYRVEFRTFDGPHRAPPEMVEAAMTWLAAP